MFLSVCWFQVRDFIQKLEQSRECEQQVKDALRDSQERASKLGSQLTSTSAELEEAREKLEEAGERIKRMEEDAGAEFRNKIRLLERKLADSETQVCDVYLCVRECVHTCIHTHTRLRTYTHT